MDNNIDNKSGLRKRYQAKLNVFDWLKNFPDAQNSTDWVEVKFKNTRKDYFINSTKIQLKKDDIVAVESSPGHDIGKVTLTGALVTKQMKKINYRFDYKEQKRIYRIAKPVDIEKYKEAKAREHDTMLKSRQIAKKLGLNMKIGDVEYQGDGNKAIFYYIADERVDFRQLIKILAETFRIRIEMKQIGARQEAGRIGGIGPCGRELCCSSWMSNFKSVSTTAAREQDLSLNPQKLAGLCAKLKCCLNYEIDTYCEAQKKLPARDIVLQTKDADYYFSKVDILSQQITYSTSKTMIANAVTIPAIRAHKIIQLNKKGIKVNNLSTKIEPVEKKAYGDLLDEEVTRFDRRNENKSKRNNNSKNKKYNRRRRSDYKKKNNEAH